MNDKINFCQPGMMSMCTAPESKNCKHYKASSMHIRCMFQSLELSEGWHCGCSEAQQEASNADKLLLDALELIEEGNEGNMPT
jgi:hypothetical protein